MVVKTKAQAEDLKKSIASGKMTMYQAAQKYSIAPRAKDDLGEVGWVNRGQTVPALDSVIFALASGEVGGPVETPKAGIWSRCKMFSQRNTKTSTTRRPRR